MKHLDVIVIGAGAAGLFCAATAGKRGRSVEVLDHAKKVGRKILMSGGGRCNFTNMYTTADNFLSGNPHFCKSALSQYTQWDFINLVAEYGIEYHEKTLGQLFCNESAKDIVNLLVRECDKANVIVTKNCEVIEVKTSQGGYHLVTANGEYQCQSLVIATGGLSMPKLGATPFGYKIAEQFQLDVKPTRAGLVPFTLHDNDKMLLSDLSGISLDSSATAGNTTFNENILFTHRGLSGPAVLQISSYWQAGEEVTFNLYPNDNLEGRLNTNIALNPDMLISNVLSQIFPKRFVNTALAMFNIDNQPAKRLTQNQLRRLVEKFEAWKVKPNGTEGYRTAEVTLGGVDTAAISSKTMEVKSQPGLFFVGEVLDVTGWLGGYNFQWAWSSGFVAGMNC